MSKEEDQNPPASPQPPVTDRAISEDMGGDPPCHLHEVWDPEREARFEAIDRIRQRVAQYTEEEVMADIEEAIREVRREEAQEAEKRGETPQQSL